jgi:hypothetical protein
MGPSLIIGIFEFVMAGVRNTSTWQTEPGASQAFRQTVHSFRGSCKRPGRLSEIVSGDDAILDMPEIGIGRS